MEARLRKRGPGRLIARSLGLISLLVLLMSLAVGIGMAAPDAPDAPDAPAGASSIGDCVFNDANVSGQEDAGDVGINGVTVFLYKDGANNAAKDGVLQATEKISETITIANPNATGACSTGGYYIFPAIDGDETYWVELPQQNFAPNGPLAGFVWTTEDTIGTPGGSNTGNSFPGPIYKKTMPRDPQDFVGADFGLVKVDLRIRLDPLEDVNPIKQQHTFNVFVESKIGSGPWTGEAGENPTVVIVDKNNNVKATTSNTCTTGTAANGQCSVVINSDEADLYTANASVTANVVVNLPQQFGTTPFPVSRTVDTDPNTANIGNGPGGTGPATKIYAELRLKIDPPTATNQVGEPHDFTITLESRSGNGTWQPVAGNVPTFAINPNPPSATNGCSPNGTNANGQCVYTINSETATVYTLNAQATATVAGIPITVDTDPSPAFGNGTGGSGPAQKTYVDLRIFINPAVDTNPVNQEHVFTVKVEQKIGDGNWTPVANVNPTVAINRTPSARTDGCAATGTDAQGECTVTINSNRAEVYTANATIVHTVQGEQMARDTDPATADRTAPGAMPAVKNYVNLRITLSPGTAINAVNDPHVVTALVEKNEGTGWTPIGGNHAVVFQLVNNTAGAGFQGANNCNTVNGTCTITINSSTVGSVDIRGSVTAPVSNIQLTRTSGSQLNNDAGGSADANKEYRAGSIGDRIWWDVNKDGLQGDVADEPGIPNVNVRLYNSADCSGPVLRNTPTLANGIYLFAGLGTGTYCVEIDPAEFIANGGAGDTLVGWTASPVNAPNGTNSQDAIDSDADPTTHRIQNISIDPVNGPQIDRTNDAGFSKSGDYTVTKTRISDLADEGVRPNEPVVFRIVVRNIGTTWLTTIPLVDDFDDNYIAYNQMRTGPNPTTTAANKLTWDNLVTLTGITELAPGQSITLEVEFLAVKDTTELTTGQAPCNTAEHTCNIATVPSVTSDPDGPIGPLPANEVLPLKFSFADAKITLSTAIALASYGVDMNGSATRVFWTTVNEVEIVSFNLFRLNGAGESLVQGKILAKNSGAANGDAYQVEDDTPRLGNVVYVLETLMANGSTERQILARIVELHLPALSR